MKQESRGDMSGERDFKAEERMLQSESEVDGPGKLGSQEASVAMVGGKGGWRGLASADNRVLAS